MSPHASSPSPSAPRVTIFVNGEPVAAHEGQSVAAALLSAGRRIFRRTRLGAARGLFCGIGVCYDCLVTIDGLPNRRACMASVREGMRVKIATANHEQ
ncbi:MAG: (2Fe-2S)-binding protein [Chloroflexi bacterium]|nr:(2Fe-2S)-binding protein [Chloroflexota bacterium]